MNGFYRCRIFTIAIMMIVVFLSGINCGQAAPIQVNAWGQAWGSSAESLEAVKGRAKREAWRHAVEQAAVMVQSVTQVKNMQLEQDDIQTLADGMVYAQHEPVYSMRNEDGGTIVEAQVQVMVDVTEARVQEMLLNRQRFEEAKLSYRKIKQDYERILLQIRDLRERTKVKGGQLSSQEAKAVLNSEQQLALNDLLHEGERYIQQGDIERAKEVFDTVVAKFPNAAQGYTGRARCKSIISFRQNKPIDWDDVLADFNRAMALDPQDIMSYVGKTNCYIAQERPADALAASKKVMELAPGSFNAFFCRALAYTAMHDYRRALQDYNAALQITENAFTYMARAIVYQKMGDFNKAMRDCERGMQLNSEMRNWQMAKDFYKELQAKAK